MSDRAVRRVSRFVSQQIWAIREATLDVIVEVMRMRAAGIQLTQEEVQARIGASGPQRIGQVGSVAVLPLYGVICPKVNAMSMISGGTSLEVFMMRFRAFRDDPSVTAIVIDADTPGGSVFGVPEAFDELFASRDAKPLIAVVNPSCGSAGLWLTAACGEIVCTPSGDYGSLGVFCVHEDFSKANELMGIKPTYISAGTYKVEGNPDEPLGDDTLAFLQSQVNAVYGDFIKAVSKGRGQSTAKVKSDYGQGRMLLARDALTAGMVDRIDTFDNVIAKLTGAKRRTGRAAAAEPTERAAAVLFSARADERGLTAAETADVAALVDESLLRMQAMEAIVDPRSKKETDEVVPPDEEGACPDGYDFDEADGQCHLTPAPTAKDKKKTEAVATNPADGVPDSEKCPSCNGSGLRPERFMSDPQGQETCPVCNGTGKKAGASSVDENPQAAADRDALALALAQLG